MEIVYADGGHSAENHRYCRGDESNQQRVLDGGKKGAGALHRAGEQIGIQTGGESGPTAHHPALGKREYGNEDKRSVQDKQENPDISLGKNLLHHIWAPSVRPSEEELNKEVIPIIRSIMKARVAP